MIGNEEKEKQEEKDFLLAAKSIKIKHLLN